MTSNATSVPDDSTVRALLDDVYSAWAAGNADAFVARYAQRSSAMLPGSWLQGREAIRATMAEAFAGPLKGRGESMKCVVSAFRPTTWRS
jgi:uncharacterized protein (TIGR02246 family)